MSEMKEWEDLTEEEQNALIKFFEEVAEILTPIIKAYYKFLNESAQIILEAIENENSM